MTDVFTREFSIKRQFTDPIDLYLVKKNDNLMCWQVSAAEVHMTHLMKTDELSTVPDYCRIANKHKFKKSIDVRLAGDLALIDDDVCNICKLPSVLTD